VRMGVSDDDSEWVGGVRVMVVCCLVASTPYKIICCVCDRSIYVYCAATEFFRLRPTALSP
jgi:hypothetical protein